MYTLGFAAIALVCATGANAWGFVGHEAVGYIAMDFLAPRAAAFVRRYIGAEFNHSLGPAAPWADTIRSQPEFAWTSNLHFVNPQDDPPDSCSISHRRDCANNECILGAIANFTTQVVDRSLSAEQRSQALMFLDHFIGDVGQPLHTATPGRGGNDFPVQCDGRTTNLHSVWDSGILNIHVNSKFGGSSLAWARSLSKRIRFGDFRRDSIKWISCSSTTKPARGRSLEEEIRSLLESRDVTPLRCPLVWAADSNAINCDLVFDYADFDDLCTTSYYDDAIPIIEEQVAKQGFRLAAWLNVLFGGSTKHP